MAIEIEAAAAVEEDGDEEAAVGEAASVGEAAAKAAVLS